MNHVQQTLGISERKAYRLLHQPRLTQWRVLAVRDDESALVQAIIDLAAAMVIGGLRRYCVSKAGVNHKRVERILRQESLKVLQKQHKRRRLWLHDGSCIRLRATHKNHVWVYDFVMDRTDDGRAFSMLTVINEYTHECLAFKTS